MEQFLKYLDLGNQPFELFTRVASCYFVQRSQVALPMLPWKRTGLTLGKRFVYPFLLLILLVLMVRVRYIEKLKKNN